MDIYIKSRGVKREHDYHWLKITNQGQSSEKQIPPIPDFSHLIDADVESLSLVSSRINGKLILLITGLKTIERKDISNTKIRNSVLWICENDDDESIIRTLIVQALRDDLNTTIDNVVKSNPDKGFDIIASEYPKLIPPGITGKTPPNEQLKIGNLDDRKKELANEITNLTQLPQHDGILIVVRGICDKSSLKNTNVWRGLLSQINSEDEEWDNLDTSRYKNGNSIVLYFRNFYRLLNRIPKVVIVTVTVFFLITNMLLIQPFIFTHKKQETNTNSITDYQKCQTENLHFKQVLQDVIKFEQIQKDDLLRYVQKQRNESENLVNNTLEVNY